MQTDSGRLQPDFQRPEGIPPLVWRWMEARGLHCPLERDKILKSSLRDMRDPSSLRDLDKAVERLLTAFRNQEKICVYGDFDLDGSSGLALSVDALEKMGFEKVVFYQPKRLSEGYGLHNHAIEKFKQDGVGLILTVDVGITAIEEVEFANSLGIDVIITDHHLPRENLPPAVAVVNPNAGSCESGLGHLCGAGVAYYLMLGLRRAMKEAGLGKDFNPKDLLDLFIIGTLTDMVPVIEENRTLCKHGLIEFENTSRPGLRSLLKALGYEGKSLSAQDLAIGIAPKLNALSRLEMGLMPVDVLMSKTEEDAESNIKQVLHLNSLRKTLQQEAEEDAAEQFETMDDKSFAFVWSSNYHKGVVGLAATKLAQNYGVCAFVGTCDLDGKITGSARVPDDVNISLPEALEACSEFLLSYGGHAQAAGFSLKKENEQKFREALGDYIRSRLKGDSKDEIEMSLNDNYDCEAKLSEVNPGLMKWLEALGPFGQNYPVPVFKFSNVQVRDKKELRGGHIKLRVSDPADPSSTFDALMFSPSRRQKQVDLNMQVDLFAEVQWNYFAGRKSIQYLVREVKFN